MLDYHYLEFNDKRAWAFHLIYFKTTYRIEVYSTNFLFKFFRIEYTHHTDFFVIGY